MKKNIAIIFMSLMAVVLGSTSCSKSLKLDSLYGEWKLESVAGESAESEGLSAEIYLNLMEGGAFELFQKVGGGHFAAFDGSFGLDSGILYGEYSDGSLWGGNYCVSLSGDRLKLINSDVDGAPEYVYVRTSIPQSVRDDAADYATTKSAAAEELVVKPLL